MADSRDLTEAVQGQFEDGELVVSWVLVAEISRTDNGRYLAHRAGDVTGDGPMVWTALGMLESGVLVAKEQLREQTGPPPEDEE